MHFHSFMIQFFFFVLLAISGQGQNGPFGQGEEDNIEQGNNQQTGMIDPIEWEFSAKKTGEKRYELILKPRLDEGWHIYGPNLGKEKAGPVPTSLTLQKPKNIKRKGDLSGKDPIKKFDENFQMELTFLKGDAELTQSITIEDPDDPPVVKGAVEFMVCDDKRCLPPESVDLSIDLAEAKTVPASREVSSDSGKDEPVSGEAERSWLTLFLFSFGGGLLAIFMPCVLPIIPLTVSFFTKQSKSRSQGIRNAWIYSLSIVLIYVTIGFLITIIFGTDALNKLSTNVYMNLFFGVLLVAFAFSFLGAFELRLPSSWVNKTERASEQGGLIGIFFMALTLTLVSFSCTAPIIGPLLYEASAKGGVAGPLVGMFGFSLALALPFGLFAAFPAWLRSLPSAGGWMNTFKVTLGFIELAFAFKFFSNADLVMQAGILKRELFLIIWTVIFLVLGLYLLGLIKLPDDPEGIIRLSVPRVMVAMASLVFALYLLPGIWGAPLKMISGFPPPDFYKEWRGPSANTAAPSGAGKSTTNTESTSTRKPKCPLRLNCYHDYEKGLARARKVGKPVMLDFTGWACANCRRMEENVWSDPTVLPKLKQDVVLVSLYVDQRSTLPEEKQKTATIGDEKMEIETVGDKWAYFQASRFNTNAQPFYVMLDHNGEQLTEPVGYSSVKRFRSWLDRGIQAFKKENEDLTGMN